MPPSNEAIHNSIPAVNMTEAQEQVSKKTPPSSRDDSVKITGLEILEKPSPGEKNQAQNQAQHQAQPRPQSPMKPSRGKAALSPVRQHKGKLQRKKIPPNRTKSLPRKFTENDQSMVGTVKNSNMNTEVAAQPVVQKQQNTRQAIQQQPLARVTRRSSMGAGLGYSNQQPAAPATQPVVQSQQQRPLARVPRRSSMGAAPGYNAQPVQVQPQKQRYGQMRRNSVGGAQALPRVNRRVSIGNQAVGVEQVRWGQKPQRRSSLNNTSNYQYAVNASVQPPQSQIHCQEDMNDVSNNSTLSRSLHGNESFDFSRRSSLSSHDSNFIENSRGIFQKNVALDYNDEDDSFASSCYSYANDSVDMRGKKGTQKLGTYLQSNSGTKRAQQRAPRRLSNDSFSSCGDTYAADSLDLRRKASRRMSNDSLESSCGSTYAADSIDLRRNNKLRQKATILDEDLGYGDARPSSADEDLGYGDARPSSALDNNDDSFASSCYSYANDSIDMRQMRKKQAARGIVADLSTEDLGYGDARPANDQVADLGYGDATPIPTRAIPNIYDDDDADSFDSSCYSCANDSIDMRQMRKKQQMAKAAVADDVDLGYGDARPSSAQEVDLGYGDAIPTSSREVDLLGYGDARPSSDQAADLGYGDAIPSSDQAVDLGYGDAKPASVQIVDLGYGVAAPCQCQGDEDSDYGYDDGESSYGSASYSCAADSVTNGAKRRTATTTNMEEEEEEDDDDEDDDADSSGTPMDYMTRIVMGYCNKQEGARRDSLESMGTDSCYSYACNSVDLRPKKMAPKVASVNKEGYDDDSEDYSDDSSVGGNAYISGGMHGYGAGKIPGPSRGAERRLSCNSLANDSVHLQKFGQKKPAGTLRRTSMDSLSSNASSKFSGGDLDPDYLHSILGYAMDTSANSLDIPDNVVAGSDGGVEDKSRISVDSMTSMHSDDDDGEDEYNTDVRGSPTRCVQRVFRKVAGGALATLGDNPKTVERCHSQPMLGRHNKLISKSSDNDSFSDDYLDDLSDDEIDFLPTANGVKTSLEKPKNDPVRISVLRTERTA